MPPVKTKSKATSRTQSAVPAKTEVRTATASNARELLSQMMNYEAAARDLGIDFTASRYRQMTASERDFVRAELIADYIRLSAGNTGSTPGYYDAELLSFCSKIRDMGLPSQELAGTYLAAVRIASSSPRLKSTPWLIDAIHATMPAVLQACVDLMNKKTRQKTQAIKKS